MLNRNGGQLNLRIILARADGSRLASPNFALSCSGRLVRAALRSSRAAKRDVDKHEEVEGAAREQVENAGQNVVGNFSRLLPLIYDFENATASR
jgi:hypothetical protein